MAVRISTDKLETYRATARQSWVEERGRLVLRHECGWAIARQVCFRHPSDPRCSTFGVRGYAIR